MATLTFRVIPLNDGWTFFLGPSHAGTFPQLAEAVDAAVREASTAIRGGRTNIIEISSHEVHIIRSRSTPSCCDRVTGSPSISPLRQ